MSAHHAAQGLASLGRNGDTMLVHMQPHEVAGLHELAKMHGGELTINPHTGLPEAFNLGGFFQSMLPTVAGIGLGMVPGMYPLTAGLLTGALTGVATGDPMKAVMGGLGGYGGAGLGQTFGTMGSNMAQAATTASVDPSIAATESFSSFPNAAPSTIESQPGMQFLNGSQTPGAAQMANETAGNINQFGNMTGGNPTFSENLTNTTNGIKDLTNEGGWDRFKSALGNNTSDAGAAMKLGMPLGGALLGGLEPSDLYGTPLKGNPKDVYDPRATLNLSGDTGLRLV